MSVLHKLHKQYLQDDNRGKDEYNPYDHLFDALSEQEKQQAYKEEPVLFSLFAKFDNEKNCKELAYAELDRLFPDN